MTVCISVTVPVALLLNVLRIGVMGPAVQVNPNFATGQAHMLIGTLLRIPGFLMYRCFRWALIKAVRDGDEMRTGKGGAE